MEKAFGFGDANGEGACVDSAERAVADDDDRRRWVELHDVLHPLLDVTDEVAIDDMRRCPAVRSHGELQRTLRVGACGERVADDRWR